MYTESQQSVGIKLPYAIRTGRVVDISMVDSGLCIDCKCPVCGSPLVAKKGQKVQHHFAHYANTECRHAGETILHLASKEIIERIRRIRLPAVILEFQSHKPAWTISEEVDLVVDEVFLETKIGEIVPDIIVVAKKKRLAIEVTVTHKTSADKVSQLAADGYSVLEIDLSGICRSLSLSELQQEIIEKTTHKKWLFNHKAQQILRDLYRLSTKVPHVYHGQALHVMECPLPARVWRDKPYANVIDDCLSCKYCLDSGLHYDRQERHLYCLGHKRIGTFQQWKDNDLARRSQDDAKMERR